MAAGKKSINDLKFRQFHYPEKHNLTLCKLSL